ATANRAVGIGGVVREAERVARRDPIEHSFVERSNGRRVAVQVVEAVGDPVVLAGDRAVSHDRVVDPIEQLPQTGDGLPSYGGGTGQLHAMVGENGNDLGCGVHHQRQDTVPRAGPLKTAALVPVGEGGGVPVVTVGDQQREWFQPPV